MNRRNSPYLLVLLIVISIFGVLTTSPFLYRSVGETSADVIRLNQPGIKQVLGVSTEYPPTITNSCPEEKPIIGWIDYAGKKLLLKSLPQNQQPSVCFISEVEGNSEGYYFELVK